jgi:hypothetical protein
MWPDLEDRARLRAFAQAHVARLAAQPRAFAFGAGLHAAVAGQLLAHRRRIGLAVAPLHVGDDALEGVLLVDLAAGRGAGLQRIAEADLLRRPSLQQRLADVGRQVLEWRLHVELVVPRQAVDHAEVVRVAAVPALDRAAGQRQFGEGHHARRVEEFRGADAVAAGTRPHRRIEREQARLQFGDGVVAHRAGELGVEQVLLAAVHFERQRAAFGQAQRGLEAFGHRCCMSGRIFRRSITTSMSCFSAFFSFGRLSNS